jgi:hypothetical protein
MAKLYVPDDWPAMKQAVYDWALASAGAGVNVYWSKQDAPMPPTPRVRLDMVTPLIAVGRDERRGSGVIVIVSTVSDLSTYTVTVNGTDYSFVSGVDATTEQIRDGLIAQLSGFEVSVFTSDSLKIEDVTVSDTLETTTNLSCKIAFVTLGVRRIMFSVDVMDDDDAIILSEKLRGSLESELAVQGLQNACWAFTVVEADRKLDIVNGSEWELRSGFDMTMFARSRRIDFVDWIDEAEAVGAYTTS